MYKGDLNFDISIENGVVKIKIICGKFPVFLQNNGRGYFILNMRVLFPNSYSFSGISPPPPFPPIR